MTAALAFGDGLGSTSEARVEMAAAQQTDTETPIPSPPASPVLATIGRFARANWYAEILDRLELCAGAARAALTAARLEAGRPGDWHRLANSGLPERPLAVAAGLGSPGRSGLLLVPGAGPGVVLGLLLVPFDALGGKGAGQKSDARTGAQIGISGAILPSPGSSCGSCRVCVDACPTGALGPNGEYERESCIQHWSSREGGLPDRVMKAWGDQLYGCDLCTVSCPRFSERSAFVPTRGILGQGLPAAEIAVATDGELKTRLRGTALGMGWISASALRRNARMALDFAASQHDGRDGEGQVI
jgi:ferredoxin